MKVEKKDLEKSQIELNVELSVEEFKPYIAQGAKSISKDVKIDGFRPGNVPLDILKQKIGEMTILEEAAHIAINKTINEVVEKNVDGEPIGRPQIDITKLAPGNPLQYKIVLAVSPEIKLGDYKSAKVKMKKIEIENSETNKMLDDLREMKVKEAIVEREIKDNDKALVDIQMFLDKVPVEGGQGKGAAVIIGKNYIVAGFDKKIIGAKKDDVREFSLPYPKDYHMKNLAGKIVEFKVTIKEVYSRELPVLDDDFAVGFGLKKIDELKENIKKSMLAQKEKEATNQVEKEMLEKIMEKTKFNDIPELLIKNEGETMVAELEQSVAQQGGKFDDYLSSIGKTRDQLMLELLPDAVKRVKISLVIKEIAKTEKVKVSDDDIDKNIEEMRKHYKDQKEIISRLESPEYRNYVQTVLNSRKVIEKLKEWNIEK